MLWRRRVAPFVIPIIRGWFRLTRGLTLGVRGVVIDAEGRVLLLEHTYVHGWHLPGGGVEQAEPAETALARELVEEAGIRLTDRPKLLSIHDHNARHRGDHVLVYLCKAWTTCAATSRGEIYRTGWFAPDALPAETTPSTRARIREALFSESPDLFW